MDPELSNKKLYSTFVRTYAQTTKLPDYLLLLLAHFKWENVGLLFEETWLHIKDNIKKRLKLEGIRIRAEEQLPDMKIVDEAQSREEYEPEMVRTMKLIKEKVRSKFDVMS